MTENISTSPTRPPLRRLRDDRVIGGVASGFARWLGIDPVIVRVVLVVLAVFGGSGLILYAAGWLFIPEEGAEANEAQKLLEGSGQPGSTGRVAFIVVGACLAIIVLGGALSFGPWNGVWFVGGGGSLLLLLAAGGLVLWLVNRDRAMQPAGYPRHPRLPPPHRARQCRPLRPRPLRPTPRQCPPSRRHRPSSLRPRSARPSSRRPQSRPATRMAATAATPATRPGADPAPPRAPKPRSYLGAATLSVALVAMGVLVALNVTGATTIPAVVVLSTGLGVLGLGLLVGTFVGKARWLLSIAIPLLLVIALVALVPANLRLGTQIADRSWSPSTPAETVGEFRVDIGQGQLDLTDLVLPPGTTTYPIRASVGIGDLEVIAPEGVRVIVDASVGAGRIAVEGQPELAAAPSRPSALNSPASSRPPPPPSTSPSRSDWETWRSPVRSHPIDLVSLVAGLLFTALAAGYIASSYDRREPGPAPRPAPRPRRARGGGPRRIRPGAASLRPGARRPR